MQDIIQRMDRWLCEHRSDYYKVLLPGVDSSQLAEFETTYSLQLPDSFRQLYRWRNGQSPDNYDRLVGNWSFSRLGDIMETKTMLDDMIGADFEEPEWWRASWIPFLSNGGGDHLCLDIQAEDGGTPGQLLVFWHDWEDRSVESPALSTWLEELVQSMEDGSLELA